ncbi:MAG: hypothetical protein NZ455_00490 [Bacteroidia bacterium]|nr:hypothetical protein [Bacteroidia bacterium]MDW8347289.1 hypothetical protein [Bacteroidia bacterium]
MREACGGCVSSAKPLAHAFTLDQGVGGWGAAPLARSTPTLWAYAQHNAHKDTPKKIKYQRLISSILANTTPISLALS